MQVHVPTPFLDFQRHARQRRFPHCDQLLLACTEFKTWPIYLEIGAKRRYFDLASIVANLASKMAVPLKTGIGSILDVAAHAINSLYVMRRLPTKPIMESSRASVRVLTLPSLSRNVNSST